ncbi:MAG TPA: hypothetical protein VEK80_09030 [Kribbellaceae bacterium]|nr:hypothetical protein [Kribbellaceae bacterium]
MSSEGRQPGDEPEPGVMLRPEAVVLGEEALVPAHHLVQPPPNRFTHRLVADEPYWFDRGRPGRSREPDGVLAAGTPVVLLAEGGDRCRVVDGNGLYVEVRRSSLRPLPDA